MSSTGSPDPHPDERPATTAASPASEDLDRSGAARRIVSNRRLVRAVGIVILAGLTYYSLFVVLPSEVSWSALGSALRSLSVGEVIALVASGLLVVVVLGWTSKASLPGLTLYQGLESSATSQLTAFLVPPPGDMLVRFAMYRTYGFTDEQSAVAVTVAMVARYAMVLVMPVLGLVVVIAAGQGTWTQVWCALVAGAVLGLVGWVIVRIVNSDEAARAVGRQIHRVVHALMVAIHRHPPEDLEESVVSFGRRSRATFHRNGWRLVASNLAWGLSTALVMLLAVRFAGLGADELTAALIVLGTGLVMALNMLPIPGKDALAASAVAGVLHLSGSTQIAEFTTALLLFRLVTWLMPMAVGAGFFFVWRWHVRRESVQPGAPSGPRDSPA